MAYIARNSIFTHAEWIRGFYKFISCIFILFLFLTICPQTAHGVPASPAPINVSQPDGIKIKLSIRGDEWFHWYEDIDGYTVIRDNGRYAYAQLDKTNHLAATGLTAGKDNPKAAGLKKKILPPPSVRRSMRPTFLSGSSESSSGPAMVPPAGAVKNLVVLCKFSDHTFGVHTRDAGDYSILFNQIGGDPTLAPTGSVKDLYLENSYNTMTLQSTVTVWVTLPNTEAYYAYNDDGTGTYPHNAQKMVADALNLIDPLVDFSQFDNDNDGYIDAIDIIHSGYGAETGGGGGNWIWSHRWTLWALPGGKWTSSDKNANNVNVKVYDYHTEPALWGTSGTGIVRFGVIAHETGHFFGLPDLYDTDGSGEGIGSWCMMANSWGFDNSQLHPPHFSAWSKIQLGWVTPTVISLPGSYTIGRAETNAQAYKINYGYPSGEYLLIENRQPAGIESTMPQGGLCIFHIDDNAGNVTEGYPGQSGWPSNGNHYHVALLQADGSYDMEHGYNRGDRYDVYRGGGVSQIGTGPSNYPNTDAYQSGNIIITNNTVHNISTSGASMSFAYDNGSVAHPPFAQAGSIGAQINTPITVTLTASDDGLPNPPGHLSYIISVLPTHGSLSDPSGGIISSVPYTLIGSGNQVVYTPTTGYSGADSFTFKANDGGAVPNGGDSNPASVSINVSNTMQFLTEGFESPFVDGAPPGWSKSFFTSNVDWIRNVGDHTGYETAHGGSYNAMLYFSGTSDHQTYLISPAMNFPAGSTATLEFWHKQAYWAPDQDTLYVYYKTSAGGSWTLLASYTTDVSSWTKRTISLPNLGSSYYIGFLGDAKYGYGVCIDDVSVTGSVSTPYNITASADANGSINPNGTFSKASGQNQVFTATPVSGYMVDAWYLDGNVVQTGGLTYTLNNIQANHTVLVTFRKPQISASAGANGAINPSGSITVDFGATQQFAAEPVPGYMADTWYLDDNPVQTGGFTFTLNNISANHTVYVTFKIPPSIITAAADLNGNINPSGMINVEYDQTQQFTGLPNAGYIVDTWYVDDNIVQTGGDIYILNNVQANHSVYVTFKMPQIIALAGPNGTIVPSGTFAIASGQNQQFIASAVSGYVVANWYIDSNEVQTGGSNYTLYNIQADHGVYVTFRPPMEIFVDANNVAGPWHGTVNEPYLRIQDGINNAADKDTLVVANGIYRGTGNIDIDLNGKAITVRSASGPAWCIIDCNGNPGNPHRGFYFHSGEDGNSIIDGFTIKNGCDASGNYGSGISCDASSPMIRNCILTGTRGIIGAIYALESSPIITGCTIIGNITDSNNPETEGGILIDGGNPIIRNTIIANNAGAGGAIYCMNSNLSTINCTIAGNSGTMNYAGGIEFESGSATVTNTIIWGNVPEEIINYSMSTEISFSDIKGGWSGAGNIDDDPLFSEPNNDYHLKLGSPCINKGDPNSAVDSNSFDIDNQPRKIAGRVDIGADEYGSAADFNFNGIVNMSDFAVLSGFWRHTDCSQTNSWCGISDIDRDGKVNFIDIMSFIDHWLESQ